MPVYAFQCESCHRKIDLLRSMADRDAPATCDCGAPLHREVTAPLFKCEGTSGAFPTAFHAWEKKRKQKLNAERKSNGKPPL